MDRRRLLNISNANYQEIFRHDLEPEPTQVASLTTVFVSRQEEYVTTHYGSQPQLHRYAEPAEFPQHSRNVIHRQTFSQQYISHYSDYRDYHDESHEGNNPADSTWTPNVHLVDQNTRRERTRAPVSSRQRTRGRRGNDGVYGFVVVKSDPELRFTDADKVEHEPNDWEEHEPNDWEVVGIESVINSRRSRHNGSQRKRAFSNDSPVRPSHSQMRNTEDLDLPGADRPRGTLDSTSRQHWLPSDTRCAINSPQNSSSSTIRGLGSNSNPFRHMDYHTIETPLEDSRPLSPSQIVNDLENTKYYDESQRSRQEATRILSADCTEESNSDGSNSDGSDPSESQMFRDAVFVDTHDL